MIKFLPYLLVSVLVVGLAGLGYWRLNVSKSNSLTAPSITSNNRPIEVPKALPEASVEERVKTLEDLVSKLVTQVNALKPQSASQSNFSTDTKTAVLEASLTELTVRVAALEKSNPTSATSTTGKYPLYIPMGGAGGPWDNNDWVTQNDFVALINPDNYPEYKNMQLEVIGRLIESSGTGSVRLYNSTDSSAITSQADLTSSTASLITSPTFTLPAGLKTYKIQTKVSSDKHFTVQSVRIKVNF